MKLKHFLRYLSPGASLLVLTRDGIRAFTGEAGNVPRKVAGKRVAEIRTTGYGLVVTCK